MDLDDAVFASQPVSIASFVKPFSGADDIGCTLEFNGTAATVFGIGTLCSPSACFEENGCRVYLQVTMSLTHFAVFVHLLGDILFRKRHFWTVHDASKTGNC